MFVSNWETVLRPQCLNRLPHALPPVAALHRQAVHIDFHHFFIGDGR